jgi:hypothetical protein
VAVSGGRDQVRIRFIDDFTVADISLAVAKGSEFVVPVSTADALILAGIAVKIE